MTLDDMISLCKSKGKTIDEYIEIRNLIYREYELHTNEEQEILSDILEELEMLIEWLE